MWLIFAALSAVFAALTAIRTLVLLTNAQSGLTSIAPKSWLFLILSGLATGASWLCYFKALRLGKVSKVVPIDRMSFILTILMVLK